MRAVRATGNTLLLDPESPEPAPATGEAVIRPLLVGLSAADLPGGVAGSWIAGRECAGVVESLHPAMPAAETARWKGRRVAVSPDVACGACDECRAGLATHCRGRVTIGTPQRDGCLAERTAVPLTCLHAVPDHVTDEQAVLAVPVAAAMHAARVALVHTGAFVTVLGDSLGAILVAQALRRTQPALRLLGSDPTRLAIAERLGIRHRPLHEAGRRRDQALVVECTGTPAGLATALHLLRPRGRLVLTSPTSGDLAPAVRDEIDIACARSAPIHEALAALARGDIDTTGLITRRVRLDAAVPAIAAVPLEMKVVVQVS
ncbi:MAG: alcohol dehydrogenase catalytic domain-containing protein [Phycisphaerales bacterium]|nr:alcohol dehydrogenase catalytic domain-containing protein [Phycisphaerales bacterium]